MRRNLVQGARPVPKFAKTRTTTHGVLVASLRGRRYSVSHKRWAALVSRRRHQMSLGQLAPSRFSSDPGVQDLRVTATALAIALLALNVLDVVVTNFSVEHLGAVEINPLMAPLIGTGWAFVVKIGLPLIVITLAARLRSWRLVKMLRALVMLYMVIVTINIAQVAYVLA